MTRGPTQFYSEGTQVEKIRNSWFHLYRSTEFQRLIICLFFICQPETSNYSCVIKVVERKEWCFPSVTKAKDKYLNILHEVLNVISFLPSLVFCAVHVKLNHSDAPVTNICLKTKKQNESRSSACEVLNAGKINSRTFAVKNNFSETHQRIGKTVYVLTNELCGNVRPIVLQHLRGRYFAFVVVRSTKRSAATDIPAVMACYIPSHKYVFVWHFC